MAQSLYKLLKHRDPSLAIDVLAPAWSLPLLGRMPEVTRGIELPVGHGELGVRRRRQLGRALRGRYDRALVLPRSLKSALVPWFARIPCRTGFRGEWRFGLINDMRPFDPVRLNQTVRRFVALGLDPDELELPEPSAPELSLDEVIREAAVGRLGLDSTLPVVALIPGAEYGPAKQWPATRFARLASRLIDRGAEVWILGSAKEAELGAGVARDAGGTGAHNLCGQTSLAEAVELLALADAAVSNDSGLMHVSAAVGTHTVAIYGSSTPDFTPPLTPNATIHYHRLGCSPCFARTCPLNHLECLTGISVDEVFAGVAERLALN